LSKTALAKMLRNAAQLVLGVSGGHAQCQRGASGKRNAFR
jgi:hypothetical protein